jgi:23S rRNA pseudouridine2605 synthase
VLAARQYKIGATLSSTPEFNASQLATARASAWHQSGEALLTFEATRDWINEKGLLLFAPRAQQLPAPAPSLVEATLGATNAAPTLAETEKARSLVARLTGEGVALPLNLMGVPGDSPDFVVSAQVFSYIFTLRGDKAWKQPPATSGAVSVSPLGLHIFEVLTASGPMTAQELASELGREVTEAAILRSLTELWSQLRVIPLLSQGTASTLWELTTRRFTKSIKAGANAGAPTALSALISLYLAQALTATEDEIMTFLSPLTARSRVREVIHALVGARQLESVAVDGKTMLHVPGTLPVFAEPAVAGLEDTDSTAEPVFEKPKKVGTGRISSFASERKPADELRGKPVRSLTAGRSAAGKPAGKFGARPASKFGAKPGVKPAGKFAGKFTGEGKPDRERRPFQKDGAASTKKTYTKPWDEDRKPRAAAPKDGFSKFRKPAPEDREPLGAREQAGLPEAKRTYKEKSTFAAKPRTPYAAKESTDYATKSKPAYGSKPAFGGKPSFGSKTSYGGKPKTSFGKPGFAKTGGYTKPDFNGGESAAGLPKPSGFAKRPYTPRTSDASDVEAPKRPYARKSEGASGFEKKSYARRTEPASEGSFPKRTYTKRAEGAAPSWPKRTAAPRSEEAAGDRRLPKRPYKPRAADADSRTFTKAPWTPSEDATAKPKRAFKPRAEGSFSRGAGAGARKSFGSKPAGKFGGRAGAKFGKPAGASRPKAGE